nr:probable (S)-N-methylcoclaurine 3'-hydroxylase isozyme 2 [Tanacetum cinerariifolium]
MPILGNVFQIGRVNPHIRLAEMAQVYGPLISLRIGQRILIVGSSPNAASEILKTHDHALSGRDAMESRANMRENKVHDLVKYLASKEGDDIIIKDVTFVTAMNILGNASLSMDLVDYEGNGIGAGIMDAVRRVIMLVAKPQLADMFPILGQWDIESWYKKVMHIIDHELGGIWVDSLQRKRNETNISSSPKDFVDLLIEKGFTNQQINPLMEELFAAGTETTSLTIEWFIAELLKNQEVMQKVRDEVTKEIGKNDGVKESDLVRLPFLEACFKETIRLHPPGPLLIPRKATQTCEIMGYTRKDLGSWYWKSLRFVGIVFVLVDCLMGGGGGGGVREEW